MRLGVKTAPKAPRSVPAAWSVSSAAPEAAAPTPGRVASRGRGPGEERHLTRGMSQYAQGCRWGGFFTPPAAPRRVRGVGRRPTVCPGQTRPKTAPINLIHGTKVRQPVTARVSGLLVLLKNGCFYGRSK